MRESATLIMRTAFKWAGLLLTCGIVGYVVSSDLRWLYGAISIAAVPVLLHLIWRERVSFRNLGRPRND